MVNKGSNLSKFLVVIILLTISCSKDPQKVFQEEADSYRKERHSLLGKALLAASSSHSFKYDRAMRINEALFRQDNRKIYIYYPLTATLDLNDDLIIKFSSLDEKYAVLSDGSKLWIYTSKGDFIKDAIIEVAGKKADAIYMNKNVVYCLIDSQLHSYDLDNKIYKPFDIEKYLPSNSKFYRVMIQQSGEFMGIISGLAGSYNLDIINLTTGKPVVKKFQVDSSKLLLLDGDVYYIKGSSGDWNLEKLIPAGMKTSMVLKFSDIIDIEIMKGGVFLLDSRGLSLKGFDGESVRIPFNIEVKGKYRDRFFVTFENRIYAVDYSMMMDKLKYLKNKIPDVFN